MKRLAALALMLCSLLTSAPEGGAETVLSYQSETLRFTVESLCYQGAACYLTQVWMANPGKQIRKATATWEQDLRYPSEMAQDIPGAALCINGSGYVSPMFPGIPEDYPGDSPDYYYTPLGSLTITNGELFRNLDGVAYYGLTLESDGLHLYNGEENARVLAADPTQTWSFYTRCPLVMDHQSILDTDWSFANARAMRTVIAREDSGEYLIFTVTNRTGPGLSLLQVVEYLQSQYDPLWIYNLDGGPSAALLARNPDATTLEVLFGNTSRDADVMAFVELEDAAP